MLDVWVFFKLGTCTPSKVTVKVSNRLNLMQHTFVWRIFCSTLAGFINPRLWFVKGDWLASWLHTQSNARNVWVPLGSQTLCTGNDIIWAEGLQVFSWYLVLSFLTCLGCVLDSCSSERFWVAIIWLLFEKGSEFCVFLARWLLFFSFLPAAVSQRNTVSLDKKITFQLTGVLNFQLFLI